MHLYCCEKTPKKFPLPQGATLPFFCNSTQDKLNAYVLSVCHRHFCHSHFVTVLVSLVKICHVCHRLRHFEKNSAPVSAASASALGV